MNMYERMLGIDLDGEMGPSQYTFVILDKKCMLNGIASANLGMFMYTH